MAYQSISMQAGDGAEVHNVRGARAYYTDVGRRECVVCARYFGI
jgi:hypothetical protein